MFCGFDVMGCCMKNLKMIIRLIIAFTWEAPQTIIALFIILGLMIGGKLEGIAFYEQCFSFRIFQNYKYFGIGLSCFFTFHINDDLENHWHFNSVLKHEHGHTIQSLILGWLFIPLVAIPSVTFNILTRLNLVKYENYYKRIWERTASILGGSDLK